MTIPVYTLPMTRGSSEVQVLSLSSDQILTRDQCQGQVLYAIGALTLSLPPAEDGMSLTVVTVGDVEVSIDPDDGDLIVLDGQALDDGDKITNGSLSGDVAVLTYYSEIGWHASTSYWTDGGA